MTNDSLPAPNAEPDMKFTSRTEHTEESVSNIGEEHPNPAKSWRSTFKEYGITILVALTISILIKTFLVQPFWIPSGSMEPTLHVQDKIAVSKLTPRFFELKRGDIIVFEDPDHWLDRNTTTRGVRAKIQKLFSYVGLAADPADGILIKRLIGLPGDHVECRDAGGPLTVNGKTLNEPYINPETPACQTKFDVVVPRGSLWVMGDNRFDSADSSYHLYQNGDRSIEHAVVPENKVVGRAKFIWWPISRWQLLDNDDTDLAQLPAKKQASALPNLVLAPQN